MQQRNSMICPLQISFPKQNVIPKRKQLRNCLFPAAFQNCSITHKAIKKGMFIATANIPQNMKDCLIHNLFAPDQMEKEIPNQNIFSNQDQSLSNNMAPDLNSNESNSSNIRNSTNPQRVLFRKDEDEKIKRLVEIFGTKHWDFVAQFMEGRSAKQCRDRYSNYLVPGFFQGEWTEEEDSLLINLYNQYGPKWSIIQKSFHQRSANTIKNRWYYFLRKKSHMNSKIKKGRQRKLKNKPVKMPIRKDNHQKDFSNHETKQENVKLEKNEKDKSSDIFSFSDDENEIFDIFSNNIEADENWMNFF